MSRSVAVSTWIAMGVLCLFLPGHGFAHTVGDAYKLDREARQVEDSGKTLADLQKAERMYLKSLAWFTKLKHQRGRAEVLNDLGMLYTKMGRYSDAEKRLNETIELKKRIKWYWGLGNSYSNLAFLYEKTNDQDKALHFYQKALEAYKNQRATARGLETLGRFFESQGDTSRAMEYYEKALEIHKKTSYWRGIALEYLNMGRISFSSQKLFQAFDYARLAFLAAARTADVELLEDIMKILPFLARCLHKDRELEEALETALRKARASKRPIMVAAILRFLGAFHIRKGDCVQAADELTRAVEVFNTIKIKRLPSLKATLTLLSKSYRCISAKAIDKYPPEVADTAGELSRTITAGNATARLRRMYGVLSVAAARKGELHKVSRYLSKGADVNCVDGKGDTLLTAASAGGHRLVVKFLLEQSADIEMPGASGWTPLQWAAAEGHADVVELLVDKGADMAAGKDEEDLPLALALKGAHTKAAAVLRKAGAPAPLRFATASGDTEEVLRRLKEGKGIDKAGEDGVTPLMSAAAAGRQETVELLLSNGANVNATDTDGKTVLMTALANGHGAVAKALIEKGADVTAKDSFGGTVLMWAVLSGDVGIVKMVLDKGAKIYAKDSEGGTALMRAAATCNVAVVKLLLERGADAKVKDKDGLTALKTAEAKGCQDVIEILKDKEANTSSGDSEQG